MTSYSKAIIIFGDNLHTIKFKVAFSNAKEYVRFNFLRFHTENNPFYVIE
jgi:hypothetical protein